MYAIEKKGLCFQISSLLLVVFAFLRPLSLTFRDISMAGYNALEIFSIVISYLLVIGVLINFRNLEFDFISVLIFFYCGYCTMSIIWGTQPRDWARMVLPFILFFAARTMLSDFRQIRLLILLMTVGFVYPILGSAYVILTGTSVGHFVWATGGLKSQGIFSRVHPFAYSMLFFSFVYCLLLLRVHLKKRIIKSLMLFLLMVSVYCLLKSYVRTTYLGFFVFWLVFLWGFNKGYFVFYLIGVFCIVTLYWTTAERIFWQPEVRKEFSLDTAASGRISLWKDNLGVFSRFSMDKKMLGVGLSGELKKVKGIDDVVRASHNDYLALLMTLGILGLLIYLIMYITLLKDILSSGIERKTSFLFLGIVISALAMNFISNAYIYRVELSQLFWLFMGIFYRLKAMKIRDSLVKEQLR